VGRSLKVPLLRWAGGGGQIPINEGRVEHENTEMAEGGSLLLVICGRLLRSSRSVALLYPHQRAAEADRKRLCRPGNGLRLA
jgi:hypothetical protein